MRTIALIWIVYLLAPLGLRSALAHEDPPGDVHPRVVAVNGRFEVYFNNNRHRFSQDEAERKKPTPVFRRIFAADGTLISLREPFTGDEPPSEASLEEQRNSAGAVSDPQLGQDSEMREDQFRLGWWNTSQYILRDSLLAANRLSARSFSLHLVEASSGKIVKSAEVGRPARIIFLARTSEAIRMGDDIVVAWMEEKLLKEEIRLDEYGRTNILRDVRYRMVLTRWNPETGQVLHAPLADALDGNITVSLGNVGKTMLVAWNERGAIRTRSIQVDALSFVPKLPDLQGDHQDWEAVRKEINDLQAPCK